MEPFAIFAIICLLYGCFDRISLIARHTKELSSALEQIRMETEGLSQKINDLQNQVEEIERNAGSIASIAEDYKGTILRPIWKAENDATLFNE